MAALFLFFLIFLSSPAPCADYYVSLTGNDSSAGSLAAPWRNPAVGAARLAPGDRLILLAGIYRLTDFGTDIVRPNSGSAGHLVTIMGQAGARPVLAGGDNLMALVDLSGRHHVMLANLELTHDPTATGEAAYARDGISGLDSACADIILSNLYIHHLDEFGVDLGDVDRMTVQDCRIEYCGFGAMGGPAGNTGWRNVLIRRSRLAYSGHYYQGGDGGDRPYDRPDGLGLEPSAGPITILDSRAEHNYGDGWDIKAAGVTIRRSVAANNSCDGVKLWRGPALVENTLIYGRGDGDAQVTPWAAIVIDSPVAGDTFRLINLTVDDQVGGNYLMYVNYDNPGTAVNLVMINCIFRAMGASSQIFVNYASNLTAGFCLFYLPATSLILEHGAAQYTPANLASLGNGNLYGDPRFTRPAWGSEGDYRLLPGSPAMDSGTTWSAPAVDITGRKRDARPDRGCYESEEFGWEMFRPAHKKKN